MMKQLAVLFLTTVLSASAWAGFDEGVDAYDNGDFATAFSEWKPLADAGDDVAQYSIGGLYEAGLGVKKNEAEAAAWYRKAADQGNADAQNDLGMLYAKGAGVPKDYEEAVVLYRKAVDLGSAAAMTNLGWCYAKGYGIKKNLAQAERLYKLAVDQEDETAQKKLDALNAIKPCLKKASTELFGEALLCTNKAELRAAAQEVGAVVTREDDEFWYDEYDSVDLLEGSTTLTIGYVEDKFARAEYSFDPMSEAGKAFAVRDMVAGKYGKPAKSTGNAKLGPVSYTWKLKDGIKVTVSRGKPDTAVHLEFVHPANLVKMKRAIKEQEKQAEAERRDKQSKAF